MKKIIILIFFLGLICNRLFAKNFMHSIPNTELKFFWPEEELFFQKSDKNDYDSDYVYDDQYVVLNRLKNNGYMIGLNIGMIKSLNNKDIERFININKEQQAEQINSLSGSVVLCEDNRNSSVLIFNSNKYENFTGITIFSLIENVPSYLYFTCFLDNKIFSDIDVIRTIMSFLDIKTKVDNSCGDIVKDVEGNIFSLKKVGGINEYSEFMQTKKSLLLNDI